MLSALAAALVVACAADPPPPIIVPPERTERRIKAGHADLASLRRLVKAFDFEDPERFPREMPEGWYRILTSSSGRPGFPDFGSIRLDDSTKRGGKWSLQFDCVGGSMAAALPPGVIHILPGSRYRISCWVRTEEIERAAAKLVARLHAPDGRPTGLEFETAPIRSEREWTQLRLDLPELPLDAAELALELELDQPDALHPDAPRPTADDVKGKVWWDDLEVWQVPSIRFETAKAAQVFRASETPTLEIELRDLVSDSLAATVRVYNLDNEEVATERLGIPAAGGVLQVPLPQIKQPGWYRVELLVEGDGVAIARRQLDLAVLDDVDAIHAHTAPPRFGIALPVADDASFALFAKLITQLDPDFALVPLWTANAESRQAIQRIETLRPFVDGLLDRRIEPILILPTVPADLAGQLHLDPWQALSFFGSGDPQARALLEPWLLAFGQHVERWQVGMVDSIAASQPPELARAAALRAILDESVAGPVLLLPTDADREPVKLPAGIAPHALAPLAMRPGTATELANAWSAPQGVVSFELAPYDLLSDRARVEDLAMRTLDVWRAGAASLALELPLRPADALAERSASLLPEAIAWSQLGRALASRTFAGEITLPSGAHAWIARGISESALVLWSDIGPQSVDLVVASGSVRVTDLFGHRFNVDIGPRGHHFELTGLPIVVEGIDLDLALLQASARLDPATIEGRRGGQTVTLVVKNPYPTSMSGTVAIADKPHWDITPRQQAFTAPVNGEARMSFRVTLPRSAVGEECTLGADLEFAAGETHRVHVLAKALIDWPGIELARSWRLARSVETGHIDVVVSVAVTNRSNAPLDLEAFAVAKDFTQNRKPVRRLAPGQTAVRTFQFPDGARRLSGETVYLGVNDLDGDRRLATSIVIPELLPRVSTETAAAEP